MDGTVRITINQEDIAEFHEWLKRVKAIKACHIDDEPIDGCYHARIIADIPHQKGRIATYSAAEIVRMHDADSLSFGAISERLGCSKATACDAYHNCVRRARNLLAWKIEEYKRAGISRGWLYTYRGDRPGIASRKADVHTGEGYTTLGQLTDDIDTLVAAYVAACAAADRD